MEIIFLINKVSLSKKVNISLSDTLKIPSLLQVTNQNNIHFSIYALTLILIKTNLFLL